MRRILKNRRGQFVVEGILLSVVLVGVLMLLTKKIREEKVVAKMVTGPWTKVAGMTESGVWGAADATTRKKHPNNYSRFFTPTD